MGKDFLDWFAKAKTISRVNIERDQAQFKNEAFEEPDVFDFDRFVGKPDGTSTKAFVMIRGELLSELFEEVKNNPNTGYVTCVDDLIKVSTWEEFRNHPVSIIGKSARRGDPKYNVSELIYSRLCNIFGVKTQFVLPLSDDYKTIASVDLLRVTKDSSGEFTPAEEMAQQFTSFSEFVGMEIGRNETLQRWLNLFKRKLITLQEEGRLTQAQVDKLIYDFIEIYVVRRYVFRDNDFQGYNVGVVYSKGYKDISVGASIDMEFCGDNKMFFRNLSDQEFRDVLTKDMTFLMETYPQYITGIMQEVNGVRENRASDILRVFRRFANSEEQALGWNGQILNNIARINNTIAFVNQDSMNFF